MITEPLWGCLMSHLKDECPGFCKFEWEKACIRKHKEPLLALIEERTGLSALLTPAQTKRLEVICATQKTCQCPGATCHRDLASHVPYWSEAQWRCLEKLSPADCRALCQQRLTCSRSRLADSATLGRISVAQLCKRSALCGCPSKSCEEHFTVLLAKYPDEDAGLRCAVEKLDCIGLCDNWGRGFQFHEACAEPRLAPLKRQGAHSKPYQRLLVRLLSEVNQPFSREYNRPGNYLYSSWLRAGEQTAKSEQTPDSRYVPTPQRAVDKMLEMAQIKPGDVLYDLGSGDGRIVITAAKRYGIRATGHEIDPRLVKLSQENAARAGVGHLATFQQADVFTLDLSGASVITLYLHPWLNEALKPQLRKLKPGSRIVAFKFGIKGAKPNQSWVFTTTPILRVIYQWVVPWQEE